MELVIYAAKETTQTIQPRIRLEQFDPLEERRRGHNMVNQPYR
ncbi:hypothetical protein [Terasakiella sp. SH-1]|nr:hypothetical protein [Terasakiella sp. SH-1]